MSDNTLLKITTLWGGIIHLRWKGWQQFQQKQINIPNMIIWKEKQKEIKVTNNNNNNNIGGNIILPHVRMSFVYWGFEFYLYRYVCILDLSASSFTEISKVKGQTPLMAALFDFQLIWDQAFAGPTRAINSAGQQGQTCELTAISI